MSICNNINNNKNSTNYVLFYSVIIVWHGKIYLGNPRKGVVGLFWEEGKVFNN